MQLFADIVFPTAVRHPFTYAVPARLHDRIDTGLRVWVPFQKHKSIGMVVDVHSRTPDFDTRYIEKVLDTEPVMPEELLELTEWLYRFYYCGWGEAIQAALPVGLNFYAEKYIRVSAAVSGKRLSPVESRIVEAVREREEIRYDEAGKRWSGKEESRALKSLIRKDLLEIWDKPELRVQPKTEKRWNWVEGVQRENVLDLLSSFSDREREYKWVRALSFLLDNRLPGLQKDLTRHELIDHYTLNRIAEEGLIVSEEVETKGMPLDLEYDPSQMKKLNNEQQESYQSILEMIDKERFASFLLYGVTGSGKTEVYIHALKQVLSRGKGGIILVPEIGLTPQIIERFYKIFGDEIAVLHSRLTDRERYDAWKALQEGNKRIAIGARSAIFAPVRNLGMIVVDEEHDPSYKQEDPAPRYHARDVAVMRANINDAVVVMGSATPSMVALQGVRKGKNALISISSRPFEAELPEVEVLDLRQYRSAMKGPLAIPLYEAVKKAVEHDEQAILLLNRRGYASFIQCRNCGHIPECPNCAVSLTAHQKKKQFRCHYCGYSRNVESSCTECGSDELEATGTGTQQLEEQLDSMFGETGILRMDFDTISRKDASKQILGRFARKEAHILVGTQVVGKGLDFPDVTVVGVINADTELAFPSFRSGERLFQLLAQVAGRSGRSSKSGNVYFQTWQPDHPAIQTAREHNYRSFAKKELAYRKALSYPPFSRLIRFTFKGKNESRVQTVAGVFTGILVDILGMEPVLGPSPAVIPRVQTFYLWESMIKVDPSNGAAAIERLLDRVFERYENVKPAGVSSVRINVNVDALE